MLIVCPDCGTEVSQYADVCVKCGFPIKKFITEHHLNDFEKVFICPKCGDYELYFDFTPNKPKHIVCKFCHTPLIQTDYSTDDFERNSLHEWQKGNKDYEADMSKQYGHGEFDEEAYQHRKEIIAQRVREREAAKSNPIKQNIPKCPTCQSTNIKKISTTSKATNAALFGLFSNKRKKQFHCNNCGYEW